MTARGIAIIEVMRSALTSIESLEPAERDIIIGTLVADLRARHPESVSILTLGDRKSVV